MKNKLFDKNLYIEALHQTRGAAMICFMVLAASSFMFPIISLLNDLVEPAPYHLVIYNFFLPLVATIVATLLTFYLFSFMFRRKSCDFYHSIAQKRSTVYVSFAAAIMTYISIITIVCCSITAVLSSFSNFGTTILILDSFAKTVLNIIAASFLSVSAMLLACSLSGRLITAIATGVIILYFPRLFMSSIMYVFKASNFAIDNSYFDFPLGNSFNAVTGAVFDGYDNYYSVIYTVILAAIYFVLGAVITTRRKSEAAGKTSMATIPQTIFRTAFCMIFCLPSILIIYGVELDIFVVSVCIIFYFFAIIAYILYEIVTQLSIKTLLKAMIKFAYVIALNVIVVLVMFAAEYYVKSYQPEPDNIESISIIKHAEFYDYEGYNNSTLEELEKIEYTDYEAKSIICDELKKAIDNEDYEYSNWEGNAFVIKINSGNISRYRKIYLSNKKLKKIFEAEESQEKVKTAVLESFPEDVSYFSLNADVLEEVEGYYNSSYQEDDIAHGKADETFYKFYETVKSETKNPTANNFFKWYYLSNNNSVVGNLSVTDNMGNIYSYPIFSSMKHSQRTVIDNLIKTSKNNYEKVATKMVKNNYTTDLYIYNETQGEFYYYGEIKYTTDAKEVSEYILNNGLKKQEKSVIIALDTYNEKYNHICVGYIDEKDLESFDKYLY